MPTPPVRPQFGLAAQAISAEIVSLDATPDSPLTQPA